MTSITGRIAVAVAVAAAAIIQSAGASPARAQVSAGAVDQTSAALAPVLDYVQSQNTTGFLIVRDGKPILERNWPVPADATQFRAAMAYETTADGALLEDVASQQ
jgi:hypothetical protein